MSAQRVAFGTSGHRGSSFDAASTKGTCSRSRQAICEYRQRAGHRRAAVPRHRHARAVGAGVRERARGAGRQRRRGHARAGRRVHADAGGLARHPGLQPRARRRASPTASSSRRRTTRPTTAASSTTRPTAARPTPTSPTGSRRGPTRCSRARLARREAHALRAGAPRAPRRTGTTIVDAYVADLGERARHGRDPRRRRPHGRRSARRRRRALLGAASPSATGSISTVVSEVVDPTFRFMTLDWDGQIRMDPSSPYAMQRLIAAEGPLRHRLRLRHRPRPARHRHAAAPGCCRPTTTWRSPSTTCFAHRPKWRARAGGRQDRGQQQHDRSRRRASSAGRSTRCRSASSGSSTGCSTARSASAARRARARRSCAATARVWTTDKDGIVAGAAGGRDHGATGRDPGEHYGDLDARARRAGLRRASTRRRRRRRRQALGDAVAAAGSTPTELAGEPIERVLDRAPGNDAPIGGIKVVAASGWFAARPSGTEDIYKIYARELPRRGASAPHPARGAARRRSRAPDALEARRVTSVRRSRALFLDIGGVLLTDGWDRHARRRAAKTFNSSWPRWSSGIS